MNIKDKIKRFNEWCNINDVAPFKGEVTNSESIVTLKWHNDDLNLFLNFLHKVQPNILGYNEVEFDIEDEMKQVQENKRNIEQQQQINESYKKIKKYHGSPIVFSIFLVKEGALYQFIGLAEYAGEYFELTDLIEEYLGVDDRDSKNLESTADSWNEERNAWHEERENIVEPFVKQLAEDEDFQKAGNDIELQVKAIRKIFGANFYLQLGYDVTKNRTDEFLLYFPLCKLAKNYYHENILPVQEKELADKIIEMKKSGMPKVAIAAKLDISSAKLNKLLYKYE